MEFFWPRRNTGFGWSKIAPRLLARSIAANASVRSGGAGVFSFYPSKNLTVMAMALHHHE